MNKLCSYITIIFTLAMCTHAQWQQNYNSPENGNDAGNCVTIDNQNNVIVAGYSELQTGETKYSVVKYNSSGVLQWSYLYNQPNSSEDRPYGITTDQQDNIYITGYTSDNITQSIDYCTIKLGPQGNLVWARKYNGASGGEDRSYGILVDQLNNIIITGSSYNGAASGFDIVTIKYDTDGNVLGTFVFNGTGNGEDRSYGILTDEQNNILITGTTYSSASSSLDYLTLKYTPAGGLIWSRTYNGTGGGEDRSYGIVTDQPGNVFITGASMGAGSGFDYATLGYDSSGTLLFEKRYNGTGNSEDISRSIAFAVNGEISVSGSSRSGTMPGSEDIVTIRYEINGNERWNRRYNGAANNTDQAYKVVLPQTSNSYVSVMGFTTNPNGKDILIISYSSTGSFIRDFVINGSGNSDDIALEGTSLSNDIIFTGFQTNTNNNTDFVTGRILSSDLTKINKDPVHLPSSFKLYQNYPNPFNPQTVIKLDIPEESNVKLAIYNAAGEIEILLVDQVLKAGTYEVNFRAENLSSGVYFCSLIVRGIKLTSKLVLLK